jgi:hypothetical protein
MTSMARKPMKPGQKLQAWIDARNRHHLSHAHLQMARELGMNPAKLGRTAPDVVMSIEERARLIQQKKEARRAEKRKAAHAEGRSTDT